jgi:hypothetical protein
MWLQLSTFYCSLLCPIIIYCALCGCNLLLYPNVLTNWVVLISPAAPFEAQ